MVHYYCVLTMSSFTSFVTFNFSVVKGTCSKLQSSTLSPGFSFLFARIVNLLYSLQFLTHKNKSLFISSEIFV